MKAEDIMQRLRKLRIPAAYSHFNNPPKVPFVVYTIPSTERYGADNKNMLLRSTVRIELYTDHKDLKLENDVANLFKEHEITNYEDYISEQQLYMNVFEFDFISKIGG